MNLEREEYEELEETFKLFDKDGNGHIDAQEINVIIKSLGMVKSMEEIKEMIAQVDVDENAMIELPEFLAMMAMEKEKAVPLV